MQFRTSRLAGACLALALLSTSSAAGGQVAGAIPTQPPPSQQQPQQQQPQPEQEQAKKQPGRIEGAVVLTTGAPVRKAQVVLFSSETRVPLTTSTNEGGKFVFEDVPPGDYNFNANHSRYVSAEDGGYWAASGRRLSVGEGGIVKGVVVKMMPGAVVTGRILDEYGDPQPRADVSLQRYMFRQGKKQLVPASSDRSDDRGEYRIFNVRPGRYYLSVQYNEQEQWSRNARRSQAEESSYPKVFFPGVLEPDMAMAFDLRAGEERQGMDLRLVRDRAFRVKGRVLEEGRPAREAYVGMSQKGSPDFRGMRNQPVDSAGEFEFSGIRPGTYVISAMKMGGSREERFQGRAEVVVGSANVEGVTIALSPGTTIPGQVVIEGDNAAAVDFSEKRTRIFLEPVDRGFFGGSMPGLVKTDGTFELENVAPGEYRLRLMPAPDGGYVAGVLFGDLDVGLRPFEILSGMQGPFKIRLRMTAATIAGAVKDNKGQPAPNVRVIVAPELSKRAEEDRFRLESTDQYGNFTAKNMAPGEYRLWALTKIEPGQHLDPDFLAAIEKEGEKVELDDSASKALDLKLLDLPENP
ncbi:MAG: carboxypeptidase regulatory-like domain-containing protein [Bryobacteraceae bacterium]|nr:carboxypeptidase regulatory-like domain-containing protein [Bryobacteraceae bacterium]